MRLCDILAIDRIVLDPTGSVAKTKDEVLGSMAEHLAKALNVETEVVLVPLREREELQSTGIGDGVAIPHTSLDVATGQLAALLLSPKGIPFDAIDGGKVHIVFGVVGPKKAASDHLKILAKVSRLLRSPETRRRLLESTTPEAAYSLIEEHEGSPVTP